MTDLRNTLDELPEAVHDNLFEQLSLQGYTFADVHTVKILSSADPCSVIAVAGNGLREYQAYVEVS